MKEDHSFQDVIVVEENYYFTQDEYQTIEDLVSEITSEFNNSELYVEYVLPFLKTKDPNYSLSEEEKENLKDSISDSHNRALLIEYTLLNIHEYSLLRDVTFELLPFMENEVNNDWFLLISRLTSDSEFSEEADKESFLNVILENKESFLSYELVGHLMEIVKNYFHTHFDEEFKSFFDRIKTDLAKRLDKNLIHTLSNDSSEYAMYSYDELLDCQQFDDLLFLLDNSNSPHVLDVLVDLIHAREKFPFKTELDIPDLIKSKKAERSSDSSGFKNSLLLINPVLYYFFEFTLNNILPKFELRKGKPLISYSENDLKLIKKAYSLLKKRAIDNLEVSKLCEKIERRRSTSSELKRFLELVK